MRTLHTMPRRLFRSWQTVCRGFYTKHYAEKNYIFIGGIFLLLHADRLHYGYEEPNKSQCPWKFARISYVTHGWSYTGGKCASPVKTCSHGWHKAAKIQKEESIYRKHLAWASETSSCAWQNADTATGGALPALRQVNPSTAMMEKKQRLRLPYNLETATAVPLFAPWYWSITAGCSTYRDSEASKPCTDAHSHSPRPPALSVFFPHNQTNDGAFSFSNICMM